MGTDSIKNRPKFSKNPEDHEHYKALRALVNRKVSTLPQSRMVVARIRAVVLFILYFSLYALALQQQAAPWKFYLLYFGMGATAVLIYLNVIHESCHGNLFRSPFWNKVFYHFFDLLGVNGFIWEKRHNLFHHNYPNLAGWDTDIEQSSLIKVYPQGEPLPVNRYQHKLFALLYPFYLFNWVLVRDFKDYLKETQIVRKMVGVSRAAWVKMILFKALFSFYLVFVPWYFFGFTFAQSLAALAILLACTGVLALAVLLPPHANTGNTFPVLDAENNLSSSWLIHQLVTTNDVSEDNFLTRHVMGNFNYHVAHHLFPNLSSVYAPEVTEIIRNYTREHNLPYHTLPFLTCLKNHHALLKANALASEVQPLGV